MMASVEDVVRCPICLGKLQPSAKQCANGHGTCTQCVGDMDKCSLCMEPYTEVPFRLLDQLMAVLPKPCIYREQGCPFEYVHDSHKNYCQYRPIKCRLGVNMQCDWKGSVMEWVDHAIANHDDCITDSLTFGEEEILYYHNFESLESEGSLHIIGKKIFLFLARKDNEILRQKVKHVSLVKPSHEYFYQMIFKDGEEIGYKIKIKADNFDETEDQDTKYEANVFIKDLKKDDLGRVMVFTKVMRFQKDNN